MNLSTIKTESSWGDVAGTLNQNFAAIDIAVNKVTSQVSVKLPLCASVSELNSKYPPNYEGQMGLVGTTLPATLYKVSNGAWVSTGKSIGTPSASLSGVVSYNDLGAVNDVTI